MSASSISRAANDLQLQARVLALAQKELLYNEDLADTQYGRSLKNDYGGSTSVMPLMWPIAADQEEEYEQALKDGRGAPGHDTDIITDDALLSGIKSFWPADTVLPEAVPTQQMMMAVAPPEPVVTQGPGNSFGSSPSPENEQANSQSEQESLLSDPSATLTINGEDS